MELFYGTDAKERITWQEGAVEQAVSADERDVMGLDAPGKKFF